MKFRYMTSVNTGILTIKAKYNLKLPKYIIELLEKAIESNSISIYEYVIKCGITPESDFYKIVKRTFKSFGFLFSKNLNDNFSDIQRILSDGYITKTDNIEVNVDSYAPLINLFEVNINGSTFNLYNIDDLDDEVEEMILKSIPNSFDVTVISREKKDEVNDECEITLKLTDKNGFVYNDSIEVNEEEINYSQLYSQNNIAEHEMGIHKKTGPLNLYSKLTISIMDEIDEKYQSIDGSAYFLVKETSIETSTIESYKGIPILKVKTIGYKDFIKGTKIYDYILNKYLSDGISINSNILQRFIENEKKILHKIISGPNNLKFLSDNRLLLKVLLSNEDIIIDAALDKNVLEYILTRSSSVQLPIMYKKISPNIKDSLKDIKLINKIANIDISLLSNGQMAIFKDEKLKIQLMDDEYRSIIGDIAVSGIRENIKKLDKSERKLYKVDKVFKNWLNKYIGHNDGKVKVNSQLIGESKNILKKAKKINLYLENKIGLKIQNK